MTETALSSAVSESLVVIEDEAAESELSVVVKQVPKGSTQIGSRISKDTLRVIPEPVNQRESASSVRSTRTLISLTPSAPNNT